MDVVIPTALGRSLFQIPVCSAEEMAVINKNRLEAMSGTLPEYSLSAIHVKGACVNQPSQPEILAISYAGQSSFVYFREFDLFAA